MSLASLLSSPIKSRKAKSVDDPPIQTLVPPPDQPDSAKAEMMRQILLQRVRQRDGSPEGFRQVTPASAEAFIAAIAPDDPRGLNQEMPETGRPDWQREALGNALQQDLAGQNSFTPRASDNPYPKELGQLLKDPNKFSTGTAEVSIPITMGAKPTMGEQTQRDVQTPYRDPVTPFRDDRTQFQKLRNDYEVMMNSPVEDNDKGVWGRIKEALGNALYGIGQGYQQMRASGQPATWQGMLGGAVGGIGGGVANPKWDEQRRREGELNQLKGKLADAMQIDKYETDKTLAQKDREIRAMTARMSGLKVLAGLEYYNPKDPRSRAVAAQNGVDPDSIPAYDMRKKDRVEINGVTFVQNDKGGYDQAGLPLNEENAIVTFVTKDVQGNERTFRVSNKDAAKFTENATALAWEMKKLDKTLSAQAQRDEKQRQHDIAMKLLDADLQKKAAEYDAALAEAKAEKDEERKKAAEKRAQDAAIELQRIQSEMRQKEERLKSELKALENL